MDPVDSRSLQEYSPRFNPFNILNELSSLREQEEISSEIVVKNLLAVTLLQSDESSKSDWSLPIYCHNPGGEGCEGQIPLNSVNLPKNLQRELGVNLMDWFYRFTTNNVSDFKAPEVKKHQPVAQATSFTAVCAGGIPPKLTFSLINHSPREIWIILRYNLSGTKYENFLLTSEQHCLERECIGFDQNDVVITAGILLMKEPSWSSQKKWDEINYGFAMRGHFITWGKYVLLEPDRENVKVLRQRMIDQCLNLPQAVFLPSGEELRVNMLERIGFNTLLKPQVITSKSVSLLALDFTCLVSYSDDGGIRLCGQDVQFLTFYKVTSYLAVYPDLFTFSKGGGQINTLDPRKITLYHFDETKNVYVSFEIDLPTREWSRIPRYVKPEDLKGEGIEKRVAQYL